MEMEMEQTDPSSHQENQAGDNDQGNWHRRLRLRKSSASSHTVKSTIEELKVDKQLPKESSQNERKGHRVVDTDSSKLTLTRSDCKASTRFSLDGLLKHKVQPQSFPCDICSFVASDFITLQQHYLKHKDSSLICETYNGEGLQIPPHLTQHCKTPNQYECESCKFSTMECSHFLHNSCPNSSVTALDSRENSDVKPVNGELKRTHFADAAGDNQKDTLLDYMTNACRRGWSRRNRWKNRNATPKQTKHMAPDIKHMIPKSGIKWTSAQFLPFSAAGLLDENGELLNPSQTLEVTKQFLERTVNCGKKGAVTLNVKADLSSLSSPEPFMSVSKMERCVTPLPVLDSENELSGLMEKNNISVPPDCTTKVVGFRMVDGKKHLVLKVTPSAKPEVSSGKAEELTGSNQEERNNIKSHPPIERLGDQICSESCHIIPADSSSSGCDSTSTSLQPPKQGLDEDQDTIEDSTQVHNIDNDCISDENVFSHEDDPAQPTLSGIEEVVNVLNQAEGEKSASPEVHFSSNCTNDLSEENNDVPGDACSVRRVEIQTNILKIGDTAKDRDCQKEAAKRDKEIYAEPSKSQDDTSCAEALSSGASCDFGSMEEGINTQLLILTPDRDRSSDVNIKDMNISSVEDTTLVQSPLDFCNEQEMDDVLNSSTNKNEVAMFESNSIDPAVASPHKNPIDSLFTSPSKHGSLFFQASRDENINIIDSGYAHVPLDQNCTMETVEELHLAQLSPKDSGHNPHLYQTLEELPVTTVNLLLDDSEVTCIGITSQCEPGSTATQQVGMHSLKSIPVLSVSTDQSYLQSQLTEPTTSTRQQPELNTRNSQGFISQCKRQLIQNSQENRSSIRYWEPCPPEIERTLQLFPACSSQPVKVPRLHQPVVVLNHPDTDIPEVANIMRSVHRHKGAVQRVVLSQGTLKALSELTCNTFRNIHAKNIQLSHSRRVWPQGTVKERFILKLKLKRLGGKKYKIAGLNSNVTPIQSSFRCWFCGRHFRNQEVWVGHGQRHIMEATRDWNKLYNTEGQGNIYIDKSSSEIV